MWDRLTKNALESLMGGSLSPIGEQRARELYAQGMSLQQIASALQSPQSQQPPAPAQAPSGISQVESALGGTLTPAGRMQANRLLQQGMNPASIANTIRSNPMSGTGLGPSSGGGGGGIDPEALALFEDYLMEAYGAVPMPDGTYLINGRRYTYDEIADGALASVGGFGGGGGGGGGAGTALGYAQLGESQRQFDLDFGLRERQFAEDIRRFGIDEAYRRDALRQSGEQFAEDLQFRKSQLGENARQFDTRLAEDRRQFDTGLAEDQHQFDNTFVENQYQFDNTQSRLLEAMRRERSLAENEFVAGILRNPSDFVARAFLQRGVQSPGGAPLTQADLIGAIRQSIAGSIPEYTDRSAYQAPVRPVAPAPKLPIPAAPEPRTWDLGVASPIAPGSASPEQYARAHAQSKQLAAQGQATAVGTEGGLWEMKDGKWHEVAPVGTFAEGGVAGPSTVAITGDPVPGSNKPNPEIVEWTPYGNVITPMSRLGLDMEDVPNSVPRAAGGGVVFSPLMNIGSQNDIRNMANQWAPPAVSALLSGGIERLPLDLPVNVGSMRQTNQLTGDEIEALGTRLAVENTTLGDYSRKQDQLFGQIRSRRKGRLLV